MRTFLRPFSAARRSAVLPRRAAAPLAIRLSSASYATDQHRAANAEGVLSDALREVDSETVFGAAEVDKEKKKHLERDPKDKEWSETFVQT